MNFSKTLEQLISKQSLEQTQAYELMCHILDGQLSNEKISALLIALRCKGETYEEVVGFVKAMREFAVILQTTRDVVDTCGTGGDSTHTFNISTTAAFVAAGAGVAIAKHHNRSVSSKCGCADVLEELGVNITLPTQKVKESVDTLGIGFCFAPLYHQSMKYAAPVRKELGVRTVFNMLGPLLNPFLAKKQVIGVFASHLTEFFANVLKSLNSEHVFVVHGNDGIDEFSLCDSTQITELNNGEITTFTVSPEKFGFNLVKLEDLVGGDKTVNAAMLKKILEGEKGPKRDITILNAALAIVCSGKVNSIEQGIKMAENSIDSGSALNKLNEVIKFSNEA